MFRKKTRRQGRRRRDDFSLLKSSYARRLRAEQLEDRRMLAGVTVGNALDVTNGDISSISALVASDGGDGISLREAIAAANNTSGSDTITFDSAVFNGEAADVIRLQSGQLTISESVHIDGGFHNVVISGDTSGDDVLVSGTFVTDVPASDIAGARADNVGRVLNVNAPGGSNVQLTGLTLTGGNSSGIGGGIRSDFTSLQIDRSTIAGNTAGGRGGGIFAAATLTDSTVSGNVSNAGGGGIASASGTITVNRSTISGNVSADSGGGISSTSGNVELTNSTLSGNQSEGNFGGGLFNSNGSVTIDSSTITLNSSTVNGGGVVTFGTTTINNTIVAGNFAPGGSADLAGTGSNFSGSFNLLGFADPVSGTNNLRGVINPGLAPLADNGGPTQTHLTLPGSPALDAGNTILTIDQRGQARGVDLTEVAGSGSDIGAVELTGFGSNLTVRQVNTVDGGLDSSDGLLSLREALSASASDAGESFITFAPELSGQTIFVGSDSLDDRISIIRSLTIDGDLDNDGVADITVSADSSLGADDSGSGVFQITSSTDVVLDGLVIRDGNSNSSVSGAGIQVSANSSLVLANSVILDNSSPLSGGGISSLGDVTIVNSTISGNTSGDSGGGVYTNGSASVTFIGSTISNNSSSNGGGILTRQDVTLVNSTISNNNSTFGTGGLFADGSATLVNTTVSGNTGSTFAGVYARNVLTLANSIVLGNTETDTSTAVEVGQVDNFVGQNIVGANPTAFNAPFFPNVINAPADAVFAQTVANSAAPSVRSGVLGNNGGSVPTIALLDSLSNVALDAAPASVPLGLTLSENVIGVDLNSDGVVVDTLTTISDFRFDQRQAGFNRAVDQTALANNGTNIRDIGAFELQPQASTQTLAVSSVSELGSALADPNVTLIELASDIDFPADYFNGGAAFPSEFTVNRDVTIDGNGFNFLADGGSGFASTARSFLLVDDANLTLSELGFSNPAAIQADAIALDGGTLTGSNLRFENIGAAGGTAGAIGSRGTQPVTITLSNSQFVGSQSQSGAAISVDTAGSTVNIDATTFSGNQAVNGGAVFAASGVFVRLVDTTFSGNTATGQGGAIQLQGSATLISDSLTFSNNTAATGGAISNDSGGANVQVFDTRFVDNVSTNTGQLTIGGTAVNVDTDNIAFGTNSIVNVARSTNGAGNTPITTLNEGGVFGIFSEADFGATTATFANFVPSGGGTFVAEEITVSASPAAVEEGATTTFTFSVPPLFNSAASGVDVFFTLSGTATFNSDFVLSPGANSLGDGLFSVNVPAGIASVDISATTINDIQFESAEQIVLTLQNPTALVGGALPYAIDESAPATTATINANGPPSASLVATSSTLTEGAAFDDLTVQLTTATIQNTTIFFTIEAGSASLADVSFTGTVVVPQGATSAVVPISAFDDAITEFDESFSVRLLDDPAATTSYELSTTAPTSQSLTIAENDTDLLFIVSLGVSDDPNALSVVEGETNTSVLVNLTDPITGAPRVAPAGGFEVNVGLTGDFDAVADVDFVSFGNSVVVPAGESSVAVPIVTLDDNFDQENNGSVRVGFVEASVREENQNYDVDPDNDAAAVTIVDDDVVGVIIEQLDTTTTEAGGTAQFAVTLTAEPTNFVVVFLDFPGISPAIPNDEIASQTVTNFPEIDGFSRDFIDATIGVRFFLSSFATMDRGADFNPTFTGTAPDLGNYVIFAPSSGILGDPTGTFSDALPFSNFSGNQSNPFNQTQIITLTGIDDLLPDGNQTITITPAVEEFGGAGLLAMFGSPFDPFNNLSPGQGIALLDANGQSISSLQLTNIDDDVPVVLVSDVAGQADEANGSTTATYTLQLSQPTSSPVQIALNVGSQAEVSIDGGITFDTLATLTINDTNERTILVRALDDTSVEGAHSATITHSIISGSVEYPVGQSIESATVNIIDNDLPTVSIGQTANASEQGVVAGQVGIVLDVPAPAGGITVNFSVNANGAANAATPGTDFQTLSGSLTIAEGQTGGFVNVQPFFDLIDELPFETVEITLVAREGYNISSTAPVTGTVNIFDDDQAGVRIVESAAATRILEGGTETYEVFLTSQPQSDVTVTLNLAPGSTVTPNQTTVTFTPSNFDTPQTVTLSLADNIIPDQSRIETITHAVTSADVNYNSIAVTNVNIEVIDTDLGGFSINVSDGLTVTEDGALLDTYLFSLLAPPTEDVTVQLGAATKFDGQPNVTFGNLAGDTFTELFFEAGSTANLSRTVFVRGVNDNIDEDNRTVDITHTVVTDDAFLASQTIDNIQVTVSEDDVAGVTLTPSGGSTSVTQGSGFDDIVVTLDTQPRAPVTINFDTGTSLNPIAPVTIDPASFPGSVTVQVSAQDTGQLGIQSVPLSFSIHSADTAFDILPTGSLDVTVVDAQLRNDFATGLNSLLTTIDGFVQSTLNFELPLFDVGTANPEFISLFINEVVAAFAANGEVELGLLGGPLESAIEGAFAAAGVTLDATVIPTISASEVTFAVSLGNTFDTSVPLLADFGVPALGLNIDGSINPSFSYQLDLAFGVNGTDRFFVDTANTGISASLSAGLSKDFTAGGNLGFIGFSAQNQTNEDGEGVTAASVNFAASLNDINTSDSAARLSLSELQSTAANNLFSVNFDAGATIGLSAEATLGENTVLPSLLFDFDGQFNALSLNDQYQFVIGAAPTLAFNNISVDTGSLISNFAGPIFSRIDAVLEPFRPVLDLLNTDLSVVRELGITRIAGNDIDANEDGQVVLLELLQAIPGSNINLVGFQDALNALDSLVMTIAAFGEAGENIMIDLGSFELALPETGFAVGPNDPGFAAVQSGIQNNSTSTTNNVSTQIANSGSSPARAGILNNLATNPVFQFPILTDVEQAFGLLTGQTDAVLFQATLPSIDIGADLSVDFDILEVLEGNFSGNAGISSQFTFGFDTQGFFDFVESGFAPAESFRIFDGFFLADTDADGEDVPELTAGFGFSGSVSVNAFVASGSLAAGIEGEATVDFRDTGESLGEGDGRIRAISEIAANITSPQNLFNLAGSLNAFLRANATVFGIDLPGINIAEELFSFEFGEDGLEISTAFDGPLTGAQVFFDANFNGIQDANEPFSVSGVDPNNPDQGAFQLAIPLEAFDDNGNGVIDQAEGRIVVSGGFDVDTGDIQVVPFTTSTDFSVASPLTLLTLELAPVDLNAVETAVETALGLPTAFNLQTGNPLAGIRAGDADSAQVFARLAQLQNLVILGANTLGPALDATPAELFTSDFTTQTGDTRASGAVQILNQLATLINSPATIDLTDATQLRSTIEGAAAAVGVSATGLDAAIVDLVARNTAISNVSGTGETARAAIVAQVALAAADSSYGFTLENLFSRLIGVSTQAPDTTTAAQAVATALGIPAAVDIRSFNTFQEIDSGNLDAAQVLAAQTQVNSTLVQLVAITGGGTGAGTEAAALNALVQAIGTSTTPLDLTDAATIQTLITSISPSIDAEAATSAAIAIANSNQQIQDLANNAATGNGLGGLRTQVATVQTFAQGGQTDLLNQLAGGQITAESLPELIQTTATTSQDAVTQISVNEDGVQSGNLISEAAAAINTTLTVTAVLGDAANVGVPVTLPSGAIATVNADGSYTFNPNGQFEALNSGQIDVESFAFTVANGNGSVLQASATVTINGVTDPPATPQTFVVTTTADEFDAADISFATFDLSNPQGTGLSLREAISLANVRQGFDTIAFDPSVFGTAQVIGLTSQLPTISDSVTITGPDLNLLTLDAGNGSDNTFGSGDGFRLFNIDDGASTQVDVTISGLTLTGGDTSNAGGAIFNRENLTIVASQLLNNSALTSAGGNGGGIENNFGTLDVQQSTFAGNSANAGGGILNNGGVLTISNSTFSGNSAAVGGGIANNETAASFSIDSSTVFGNTAFIGGGIFSLNPASINNTIIAGSVSGGDVAGGGSLTGSFNLIQNSGIVSGLTNTVVADPQLAPLANNGGPALTHALQAGSSAIDAGNPISVAGQNGVPLFDQRGAGFDRVNNGRIDIGAFEVESSPSADFDADGDIDGSDFLAWQRGFGNSNPLPSDGDADEDSDVDAADLAIWQSQFGQATIPATATVTSEPTTVGNQQELTGVVPHTPLPAELVDAAFAQNQTRIPEDDFLIEALFNAINISELKQVTQSTNRSAKATEELLENIETKEEGKEVDQVWLTDKLLEAVFS